MLNWLVSFLDPENKRQPILTPLQLRDGMIIDCSKDGTDISDLLQDDENTLANRLFTWLKQDKPDLSNLFVNQQGRLYLAYSDGEVRRYLQTGIMIARTKETHTCVSSS